MIDRSAVELRNDLVSGNQFSEKPCMLEAPWFEYDAVERDAIASPPNMGQIALQPPTHAEEIPARGNNK
jgi:hypothetical protein